MHFFRPSQHRNASMALAFLSHAVQLSHSTPTGHVTQTGSLSHTHTHANSHTHSTLYIFLCSCFFFFSLNRSILKISIPEGMWATFLCFNGKSFFCAKCVLVAPEFYWHRAAVKSGRRAGAVHFCFDHFSLVFKERQYIAEMDKFTIDLFFFFFFLNFLFISSR